MTMFIIFCGGLGACHNAAEAASAVAFSSSSSSGVCWSGVTVVAVGARDWAYAECAHGCVVDFTYARNTKHESYVFLTCVDLERSMQHAKTARTILFLFPN